MKQRTDAQKTAEKAGRRTGNKSGQSSRTTPRHESGRYTPPIPNTVRHSPRWYPFVLLGLLLVGVIVIILNYIAALPNSPSNWYTLGSLIAIVIAALLATNYR